MRTTLDEQADRKNKMPPPSDVNALTNHRAFERDDIFHSAEAMLGIVSQIDQIFVDQKSYHLMTTIAILFRSQKQGYDIDISAFAAALNVPRTSAHRLLQDWQREKVLTLKKDGRKTTIHLTAGSLDRLVNFLDYFMTTTASIHKKTNDAEASTEAD